MEFGLANALRRLSVSIDSNMGTRAHETEFTLGTSVLKCVKTREATDEVGGFAHFCYLVEDDLLIIRRTHRFSLRKNKVELANCFISTTEIYLALASFADNSGGDEQRFDDFHCIAFSETEDARIVADGEPMFTEAADILQICAECKICGDMVSIRNIHVLHESLFELNAL